VAISATLTHNLEQVEQGLLTLFQAFPDAMRAAAMEGVLLAQREVKLNVVERLNTGSGRLRGSFENPMMVTDNDEMKEAELSSEVVYAAIQDRGGTIFPKNRLLAIPNKQAGVPENRGPRDYPYGAWIKAKSGLVQMVYVDWGGNVLFFGLTRSTIKPTWYFTDAVKEVESKMGAIVGKHLGEAIAEAVK